jgi:subtilisin family serine protease
MKRIHSLTTLTFSSLVVIAVTSTASSTFAEEVRCIGQQYVITKSAAPALTQKAISSLDEMSVQPLTVEAQSSRAVLLEVVEPGDDDDDELVPYDERKDLCSRLERANRRKRLDNLKHGTHTPVRSVSCSCNAELKAVRTPDDQHFAIQWGFHQSSDIDVDAPEAWDRATGSSSTVIAVIDTGVDPRHPDLAPNMWRNTAEVAGNGVDDDANGFVDDVHGINAINSTGDPSDDHGHGTHCAGVIAGRGNNRSGVAGLMWEAQIMAVKFLNSDGSGSLFDAIRAIDYVTLMKSRGVNVVLSNNSWGGGPYMSPLYDSINRARTAGLLFVAAAGNNGSNNDSTPSYPASYALDNIISVAAIDSQGNVATFSNYGEQSVDIGAPGVQIASTYLNNGYVYMSGTSMAAPHVSGALGLLASYASYASWAQLRDTLYSSGTSLPSLSGIVATGKLVNAHRMLLNAPPDGSGATPTPAPTSIATATPTPAPTATPNPTPTRTPAPYALQGTITHQGATLSGVRVVLRAGESERVVYTGVNGRYEFVNVLGPTSFTVTPSLAGYTFAPRGGTLTGDTTVDFAGTTQPYTLSGVVISADKAPLSGVTIDGGVLGTVTTDAQGSFTFTLPYGTAYSLRASRQGHVFDRVTLSGTVRGDTARVFVAQDE